MIFIVVKFSVRPEVADQWLARVAPFTAATRAEPGNLFFEWSRGVERPNQFVLLEAFKGRAAGEAHVHSEHFQAAMALLPDMIATTPEIIHVEVPGDSWSAMAELQPRSAQWLATPPDQTRWPGRQYVMADVGLMVEGEDGFGNAINVGRTVKALEAAGVSAIEIEDNIAPVRFNAADPGLYATAEQEGTLEAAVAARNDPTTVIMARTATLTYCPLDEALDRIRAYAQTGVEALRLVGLRTRQQLQAVHQATFLPLPVLGPPPDLMHDRAFLAANEIRVLMLGNPAFAMAVKVLYDCFKYLKGGVTIEALSDRYASPELLQMVNRTDEFVQWQQRYLRS